MTDRELDALVAQHVFGRPAENESVTIIGDPRFEWTSPAPIPYYSSSGDAMLLVVEEMQKKGAVFHLGCDVAGAYASFTTRKDGRWSFGEAAHHSPTRAVALAALRALGVAV